MPPTTALLALLIVLPAAQACDSETFPLFACEAANGRKIIELCAADLKSDAPRLQYRFGSLDGEGRAKAVELEFPARPSGSLRPFMAATYMHRGVYTQSVRFVSAGYSYKVFTEARGRHEQGAGVEVRHLASGRSTVIACSERPRFYIFELEGLVACDPDTPVGRACIDRSR